MIALILSMMLPAATASEMETPAPIPVAAEVRKMIALSWFHEYPEMCMMTELSLLAQEMHAYTFGADIGGTAPIYGMDAADFVRRSQKAMKARCDDVFEKGRY